ncbi:MAG: hypothetical protein RRC34_02925 [Lentisphaeria bacterium]|nr:hypothetical protein [Lentisphaeria bacterium]
MAGQKLFAMKEDTARKLARLIGREKGSGSRPGKRPDAPRGQSRAVLAKITAHVSGDEYTADIYRRTLDAADAAVDPVLSAATVFVHGGSPSVGDILLAIPCGGFYEAVAPVIPDVPTNDDIATVINNYFEGAAQILIMELAAGSGTVATYGAIDCRGRYLDILPDVNDSADSADITPVHKRVKKAPAEDVTLYTDSPYTLTLDKDDGSLVVTASASATEPLLVWVRVGPPMWPGQAATRDSYVLTNNLTGAFTAATVAWECGAGFELRYKGGSCEVARTTGELWRADNTATMLNGATGPASTSTINYPGHGRVDGDIVDLDVNGGGDGAINTDFHMVANATADTFQIKRLSTGAIVTWATDYTDIDIIVYSDCVLEYGYNPSGTPVWHDCPGAAILKLDSDIWKGGVESYVFYDDGGPAGAELLAERAVGATPVGNYANSDADENTAIKVSET